MTDLPPPSNTPLGVDPVVAQNAPGPAPKAPAPATTNAPAADPSSPRGSTAKAISPEEYETLMRKAGNYDMIERDPELVGKIHDHLRAKTGRLPAKPVNTPSAQPPVNETDSYVKDLKEQVNTLTRNQARAEIERFREKHPDLDEYKDEVSRLLNHGLPLDEAYRYSKAAKPQPSQSPSKAPPVVPTTETNRNAGAVDATTNDGFAEMEKRINDPKATPRMDDAIEIAYRLAKAKHAEG